MIEIGVQREAEADSNLEATTSAGCAPGGPNWPHFLSLLLQFYSEVNFSLKQFNRFKNLIHFHAILSE